MAFHLMKYHNFTNGRTGVLVLGDHDNIGAYGSNHKKLIRRLTCAYIGREHDATDCVFQNGHGNLRLKWHGTWHHMNGLVASGDNALHVEFSFNGEGQARYGKHAVLWPLFGNRAQAEVLGALGLNLYGSDYKHRQVGCGLGAVMYNYPNARHIDEDIIRAARTIILPPFVQAVHELDESVARDLGRDPLASDREYQQAALALETWPEPEPPVDSCDWPIEEPIQSRPSDVAVASQSGAVDDEELAL